MNERSELQNIYHRHHPSDFYFIDLFFRAHCSSLRHRIAVQKRLFMLSRRSQGNARMDVQFFFVFLRLVRARRNVCIVTTAPP